MTLYTDIPTRAEIDALWNAAFPQTAFVLALAQGGVRLLETVPDAPPALVRVPDMPSDVATAAGKSVDQGPRADTAAAG
jgi:hypothetical protein